MGPEEKWGNIWTPIILSINSIIIFKTSNKLTKIIDVTGICQGIFTRNETLLNEVTHTYTWEHTHTFSRTISAEGLGERGGVGDVVGWVLFWHQGNHRTICHLKAAFTQTGITTQNIQQEDYCPNTQTDYIFKTFPWGDLQHIFK